MAVIMEVGHIHGVEGCLLDSVSRMDDVVNVEFGIFGISLKGSNIKFCFKTISAFQYRLRPTQILIAETVLC